MHAVSVSARRCPDSHVDQEVAMLLAQLIDMDELMDLSPEQLREMLVKLDDEVVQGTAGTVSVTE
jgi:hypothetical protein